MTRMFPGYCTWNPVTGCSHNCPYCWAMGLALGKLRNTPKYSKGFIPSVHPSVIQKGPPHFENIFVVAMGDLWCDSFSDETIQDVMYSCAIQNITKNYLLLTKNPGRYVDFLVKNPGYFDNHRFIWGTTIETNYGKENRYGNYLGPNAPDPELRYLSMATLRRDYPDIRLFLSIEPVMKFDIDAMLAWILEIDPEFIYIGLDNHNKIPHDFEPTKEELSALIETAKKITEVRLKTVFK